MIMPFVNEKWGGPMNEFRKPEGARTCNLQPLGAEHEADTATAIPRHRSRNALRTAGIRRLLATIASKLIKAVVALLLSGSVLWWVADKVTPTRGTVYVHVILEDAVVTLDDQAWRIEGRSYDPIVCELPAGQHVLRAQLGERIVYEQEFSLQPDEHRVLAAWDKSESSQAPLGMNKDGEHEN